MTPEDNFLCCRTDACWLTHSLDRIRDVGYALVTGAVPQDMLLETGNRLRTVHHQIIADIGKDRLSRAGELGVLRLMMKYDRFFTRYLEIPEILAVVDATVSSTAVLHLQNGFILPSHPCGTSPEVFQNTFHMDSRRLLNGYLVSINFFIAISECTVANGSWVTTFCSRCQNDPGNSSADIRAWWRAWRSIINPLISGSIGPYRADPLAFGDCL